MNLLKRYYQIRKTITSELVNAETRKKFVQINKMLRKKYGCVTSENFRAPINVYINWMLKCPDADDIDYIDTLMENGEFPYDTPEVQIMAAFSSYLERYNGLLKNADKPLMPSMSNERICTFLKEQIFQIEVAIASQLNDSENTPLEYLILSVFHHEIGYATSINTIKLVDVYEVLVKAAVPSDKIYGSIYQSFILNMPNIDEQVTTKLKQITSKVIPKKINYISCRNLQAMDLKTYLVAIHGNSPLMKEKEIVDILKLWFSVKPFDFINKHDVDEMSSIREFNVAFGKYVSEFRLLKEQYSPRE